MYIKRNIEGAIKKLTKFYPAILITVARQVGKDNILYSVEIKQTGTSDAKDAKHFGLLKEAYPSVEIGEGAVICNCAEMGILAPGVRALPVEII